MRFEYWSEKFRPKKLEEVIGQGQAINELKTWIIGWLKGKPSPKAIILYGPAGSGKTASAYALANEFELEIIELNASDQRTYDVIERIAGSAAVAGTLFQGAKGRKVIILDEADNIYAAADKGGVKAVQKVIEGTLQPIILIANDPWQLPKELRAKCKLIQFRKVNVRSIANLLRKISITEKLIVSDDAIEEIAKRAGGDLRAAINDFQALAQDKAQIVLSDTQAVGTRNREITIFDSLSRIFKSFECNFARSALWDLDEDPKDVLNWIDQNIPLEYRKTEDLAAAFDRLSKADVYFGRIMRRQAYRLQRYAADLMTAGVALSKTAKSPGFVRYQPPQFIIKLARSKAKRNIEKGIGLSVKERCHVSTRIAKKDFLPMLKFIFRNNKEVAAKFVAQLELQQNAIAYLCNQDEDSNTVQEILEKAEKIKNDLKKAVSFASPKGYQLF